MILTNFDATFQVVWGKGWRRDNAAEFIRRTKGNTLQVKVCTIRTQHHCISIVASNGGAKFIPFEYKENRWRQLYPHQWKVDEYSDDVFESDKSLRAALERQMLLQFPNYITGYYDDFPTKEDILASLPGDATVKTLYDLRYSVYDAAVQEDPEWDGAIQVLCEGGWLLLPYVGPQKELILEYATFVPDGVGTVVAHKVGGLVDRVTSFFGNLHWSDFRRHIDEIGGSKNV